MSSQPIATAHVQVEVAASAREHFRRSLEAATEAPVREATARIRNGVTAAAKEAHKETAGEAERKLRGGERSLVGGVAGGILEAEAIKKVGEFLKESVKDARDYAGALRQVKATLGESAEQAIRFSEAAPKALRESANEALRGVERFAQYGKAVGLSSDAAEQLGEKLQTAAANFAAFRGVSVEEAQQTIAAGLRGRGQGLREYGIALDQTSLKQEAVRLGLVKVTEDTRKAVAADEQIAAIRKKITDASAANGTRDAAVDSRNAAARERAAQRVEQAQTRLQRAEADAARATATRPGSPQDTAAQRRLADAQRALAAAQDAEGKAGQQAGPSGSRLTTLQDELAKALKKRADVHTKESIPALTAQQRAEAAASIITNQNLAANQGLAATAGTAAAQQQRFAVAVEELRVKIGNGLVPIIAALEKFFVDRFIPALEKVAGFIERNRKVLEPLVIVLGTAIGTLVALVKITEAYKVVQEALNLVFVENPVGLVVLALAALAAGLVIAYQKSETFRDIVKTAFRFVGEFVLDVVGGIIGALEGFAKVSDSVFGTHFAGPIKGVREEVDKLKATLKDNTLTSGEIRVRQDRIDRPFERGGPGGQGEVRLHRDTVKAIGEAAANTPPPSLDTHALDRAQAKQVRLA